MNQSFMYQKERGLKAQRPKTGSLFCKVSTHARHVRISIVILLIIIVINF
jgi:heme/copper-type cytochrome/quinol oxidase subunit 3